MTQTQEQSHLTSITHEQRGGTLLHVWNAFLSDIEHEFGKETIDRWVRSLACVRCDEKSLEFEAQDSFQVLWFEEHIRPRLPEITLPRLGKRKVDISIYVKGTRKREEAERSEKRQKRLKAGKANASSGAPPAHFSLELPDLDPTATIDSFLATSDNELVLKLLDEASSYLTTKKIASLGYSSLGPSGLITDWDASRYAVPNPIYLWGPSGSGKSHLLQATAHRLKRAGVSVIMASSELFTEHVVKSIRAGEMSTFRSLWRNVDALLVDDVHLFARKSATQEEFFHTFNSLHVAGKQIIISANCLPQQLQFIEPRLVSRFEWGIVLPIEPISKRHIVDILERKSQLLHFPISAKHIQILSDLFSSNVKSAVRALEAFILRTTLTKRDSQSMGPQMVRDMLRDLIEEEERSALTPEKITGIVAEQCGVTRDDIIGKSQSREFVLPRQLAMYLIRKHLKMPYMKIGDIFSRDHSTVMSSIRHIEKQLSSTETDIGATIATIEIAFSDIGK